MNDQELTLFESILWKATVPTFAETVSEGAWLPFKHLLQVADIIEDAIAKGNGRLIINFPPRHGKSEMLSHWLPVWFLDMYPDKRIISTSYSDTLVTNWGRRVRNTLSDSKLLRTKPAKDKAAAADWDTNYGGSYLGATVGGGITGLGFDVGIIDDPHKNWAEVCSPTKRQWVIDWFNSTFYTRCEPNATIIVIQTRWHEEDLTGYLIGEHSDDWTLINFPALAEEDDFLGREVGEALCSERYDREDLLQIKAAIGTQMFAGLYQQRPAPAEGGMVKRDWMRFYSALPDGIEEWIQAWDMSFKKTTTGSFVVGQVWARKGSNYYLAHQIRERMDFAGTIRAVRLMSSAWSQATTKLVEDAANGPAVISMLKDEIPGIMPVALRGESKESRLAAVSPLFEAGNVFLPHPSLHEWVEGLIEELVGFPNMTRDDQVDTCTIALNHFRQRPVIDFELDLGVGVQENPWTF